MDRTTYTEVKTKRNNLLTREMEEVTLRAVEGEGNERKFTLSFSSEIPYRRYFGDEILDHDKAAINLKRLNEIGCVLFNHKRDCVIGKIIKAWIEDGRGCAEIEFDSDEESERIYQKVKNGSLKGVSVGYTVEEWEEVEERKKSKDGRFKGPASIARRWTALEISIVSVPADESVGVGREFEKEGEQTDRRSLTFFEKQITANNNMVGGTR